jgi:hypothetical protein
MSAYPIELPVCCTAEVVPFVRARPPISGLRLRRTVARCPSSFRRLRPSEMLGAKADTIANMGPCVGAGPLHAQATAEIGRTMPTLPFPRRQGANRSTPDCRRGR